ncbi:hypothetical protein Zmor_025696 [Zophobas morio]|uniref:Uncharacterized protein n=1 Tax=Zophobas morio TaxID=2755281 RepID=A0AA38M4B2_9CUCU|nr:hypothetical protein Zmor_025696 [Zophobas morio]
MPLPAGSCCNFLENHNSVLIKGAITREAAENSLVTRRKSLSWGAKHGINRLKLNDRNAAAISARGKFGAGGRKLKNVSERVSYRLRHVHTGCRIQVWI